MEKITYGEINMFLRAIIFGIVLWFIVKPLGEIMSGSITPMQSILIGLLIIGAFFYFTDTKDVNRTKFWR